MGSVFVGILGRSKQNEVGIVSIYYDDTVESPADAYAQGVAALAEFNLTAIDANTLTLNQLAGAVGGAAATGNGSNRNNEEIQAVKVHSVLRRIQKTEDRDSGEMKKVIALDFYPEWNTKRDFGLFAYSFYMDNGDADIARAEQALGFTIGELPVSNQKAATQRDPATWDKTILDEDEFERMLPQPITIYTKSYMVKAKDKAGQFVLDADGKNVMQKRTKFSHFEGESPKS